MAHIANLRLFIPNNLAEPFTFYVGQVRLTK
jgi:hypothetical protein